MKIKVTLELDVPENVARAIQEAKQYDPNFLEVFALLSIQELAAEYDFALANTPASLDPSGPQLEP